jgi:hypothetical protein
MVRLTVVDRIGDSAYASGATTAVSPRICERYRHHLEISTMQPTRTLSDQIGSQSVEHPNKHPAAAATRFRNFDNGSEMTRATTRVSDRRSTLVGAYQAATEMHDRIETWLNEGGAGGEPDESTSRPRSG